MELNLFNFSNIYKQEDFYKSYQHKVYDLTNIPGTNCYCDDDAINLINCIMENWNIGNINFIDSGNFHYMSKLTTDRIREPFNLIVFDNHSDMQEPQFGNILSCGDWIKEVLDSNIYVNHVYLLGVRPDLAEQIPEEFNNRVTCISSNKIEDTTTLYNETSQQRCYLSLDKDVFSELYAITNWDQGFLSMEQFKSIMKKLLQQSELLGVDICGEPDIENNNAEASQINNSTNKELIDFLSTYLP